MKVTVAEFLAKGFKFVVGDELGNKTIDQWGCDLINDEFNTGFESDCEVKFPLTWRLGHTLSEVIYSDSIVELECGLLTTAEDAWERIVGTHEKWRPSIHNWDNKEEPSENQIEKAIRDSEVEHREADSTPWKPKTAQGLRELAAQLLTEAMQLEKADQISRHAKEQAQYMVLMGWIDESDIEDVTNNHIEFYKDMELF